MSVTRSTSFIVRKVHDELICAICLNYLAEPKILACAHSFCRSCLAFSLSRRDSSEGERFECPTCRQVTQIPNLNVDVLPTSYQLKALVDIITSKNMDGDTVGSIELPECERHSLKQEYYCMECSELLCRRCMMEKHRLHNYDETEMVMLSLYTSLQKNIQSAKESAELADRVAEKLDTSKAGIRLDEGQLKGRIDTFFDQCRKQLDQCQSSLIERVSDVANSKVSSLDTKSKQIASAGSSLLEVVENLQKLADDELNIAILTKGKEYIEAGKTGHEVVSTIEKSLSEKVELSFEFKEVSSEDVSKALTHLCSLGDEGSTDNTATVGSPLKTSSGLKMFDFESENTGGEVALQLQIPRNFSLPALSIVENLNGSFGQLSAATTAPKSLSLKIPVSVIPLTQKDRFASENIYPCGIAVGTNDQIIVTDVHSNSVKVLAKTGKVIDTIESNRGSTPFRGPCAVALDEDNNIFIVERETRRIHKFSNGNLVELAKVSRRLLEPRGIAISNGKIFVTDWQGSCIHVFEHAGGNKCNHISSIGSDFLKQPAGIAINPRGNLVVADQDNHCVWILTQEGRNLIHPIGNKGDQLGQLYQPFGVTVTSRGLLVVSDKGNSCISVFTEQGQLVECFGGKGSHPGEFDQPRHLCVNSLGQIIVADELNQRIQIFELNSSDS